MRDKIADLLTIAQARARADQRKLDLAAEVRPMLADISTRPQLDLAVAVDVDDLLPEVAGGLSLALGQSFRVIDPNVRNPATAQWERAVLIFDLLL